MRLNVKTFNERLKSHKSMTFNVTYSKCVSISALKRIQNKFFKHFLTISNCVNIANKFKFIDLIVGKIKISFFCNKSQLISVYFKCQIL